MRKRALSLLLVLTLSLGLAIPAAAEVNGYKDVDPDDYFADAVTWSWINNIVYGTEINVFSPNRTCTRGEIITFLWRAAKSPEPTKTYGISDISANDYFYKAVLWAKELDMFEGDTFRPSDPCTREMAVEFMWKRIGAPAVTDSGKFIDVDNPAVDWAVHQEITAGTSDITFSPEQTCTRAQIVTFLYRAYSRGYDYQTANLLFSQFSWQDTYYKDIRGGYMTLHTYPTEGLSINITFQFLVTWNEETEWAGETDPYSTIYSIHMYETRDFSIRYYEDFAVLIGKTEISKVAYEGVYVREGHTLPDWAKETFADFL